jgi:hypothetical protein
MLDPAGEPATIESSTDGFSSTWRALHQLTQRLTACRDAEEAVLLSRADHRCMAQALDAMDRHLLPADSRELLERWQHLARCQAAEDDQYRVFTHLEPVASSELIQVLSDALAVNCRATPDGWRPVTPHETQDQRYLLRWMNQSRSGLDPRVQARGECWQRLITGRQLLYQAAGLITDLCLGSDHTPPRLPEARLLVDLLAPATRVHVALPADAAAVPALLDLLRLMPLRTWRLQDLATLDALLQSDPPAVRSLDLSGLSEPLTPEALPLLNRAIEQLPNLHVLRLPAGSHAALPASSWQSGVDGQGMVFLRIDRPDGLTLLDEAVKAWGGAPFSTRMPIARIASDPDAAELLLWAAKAGDAAARGPHGHGLGAVVESMLRRAAASPLQLQRLAKVLRQTPLGSDPSATQMTASLSASLAAAWTPELQAGPRAAEAAANRFQRPFPATTCKDMGGAGTAGANPDAPPNDAEKASPMR